MASKPFKLSDLVGEWKLTQKLMFLFVQYTFILYGWESVQMTFIVPQVKIHCDLPDLNSSVAIDPCSDECPGIVFDRSNFQSTLTEKFDLVCGRSWLQSFSSTLLMFNGMIINLLAGYLTDRFGRRRVVLMSLVPYILGALLILFSQNYYMFAVGAALIGTGYVPMAQITFVLMYELCGQAHRKMQGVATELGFCLGTALIGSVAWLLKDWFHIQIVNICLIAGLGLCWFLPESTEWLLQKGRKDEVVKTIKRIMRINRSPAMLDSEIRSALETSQLQINLPAKGKDKTTSFYLLFAKPEFRYKTLCIGYFRFTASVIYYSLALNVSLFSYNMFLSFIVSSLLNVPSLGIIFGLLKVFSMNRVIIGCNVLTGLVCFMYAIGRNIDILQTISLILIWNLTSPTISVLNSYTSSLFPTEVRGKAYGIGCFMARFGAAVAPFSKELGMATAAYVPMVLFGCMCILVIILIIWLESGQLKTYVVDTNLVRDIEENSTPVGSEGISPGKETTVTSGTATN